MASEAAAERNNAGTVKQLADLQKKKAKCEAERFTNMDQFMAGNLDKKVYQKRRSELTEEAERLDGEPYEMHGETLRSFEVMGLKDGKEITLTNREFLMLKTLLLNQDIVLSRDTLLEKVCGRLCERNSRSVSVSLV